MEDHTTCAAAAANNAALAALGPQEDEAPLPPHATETWRLYAADWAAFAAWCRAERLAALPATPATVAAYLGSLSATLRPGALARRAAAIADRHRRHGHPSPATDPAVRMVLRAARRARDVAREAKSGVPEAPSTC